MATDTITRYHNPDYNNLQSNYSEYARMIKFVFKENLKNRKHFITA